METMTLTRQTKATYLANDYYRQFNVSQPVCLNDNNNTFFIKILLVFNYMTWLPSTTPATHSLNTSGI